MVRLHPAHFRIAYPSRYVNNIYLDTPELRSYRLHVNGAAEREKLRIRWYGASHGIVRRPVLEVKARRGSVGTKLHFPIESFGFGGSLALPRLRGSIEQAVSDPVVASKALVCLPSLMNRYLREYYCTTDGRFRLTVDTEISYHSVNGRPGGPRQHHVGHRVIILELKFDADEAGDACRIADWFPFRVSKYSKYVNGISRLRGCGEGAADGSF